MVENRPRVLRLSQEDQIRYKETRKPPHPVSQRAGDMEKIQGAWRITEITNKYGTKVFSQASHYVFENSKMSWYCPTLTNPYCAESTFELKEDTDPKRIVIERVPQPGAVHVPTQFSFYRLNGDTLEICESDMIRQYPKEFSLGSAKDIMKLEREYGPLPEPKQVRDIPPVTDKLLGTLTWNNDLDEFCSEIMHGKAAVKLRLGAEPDQLAPVMDRARKITTDLKNYDRKAREYMCRMMLQLKNETWLDDGEQPLTAEQFMSALILSSISFSTSNKVEFFYDDGDIFWGHTVIVDMDAKDEFTDTTLAG